MVWDIKITGPYRKSQDTDPCSLQHGRFLPASVHVGGAWQNKSSENNCQKRYRSMMDSCNWNLPCYSSVDRCSSRKATALPEDRHVEYVSTHGSSHGHHVVAVVWSHKNTSSVRLQHHACSCSAYPESLWCSSLSGKRCSIFSQYVMSKDVSTSIKFCLCYIMEKEHMIYVYAQFTACTLSSKWNKYWCRNLILVN